MKLLLLLLTCALGATAWIYKTQSDELQIKTDNLLQELNKLRNAPPPATPIPSDYESTKQELDALKKEYHSFKEQRRTSMIGKSLPSIELASGKVYTNTEIKEVNAAMITVIHDAGVSKLKLADVQNQDLKWQAVWTAAESQIEEARLTEENRIAAELHHQSAEEERIALHQAESTDRSNNIAEYRQRKERNIQLQLAVIDREIRDLHNELLRTMNNTQYPRPRITSKDAIETRIRLEIEKLEQKKRSLQNSL